MQLQLWLPMDESVVTEVAQPANWGSICYKLLGVVPEMIFGELMEDSTKERRVQYELANLAGVRRVGNIVPGNVLDDETIKNQNWWLPFITTIMGSVPLSIFTSSSGLSVYIPTCNKYTLSSRCTRRIEYCDSLDSSNRFPRYLKSLMIYIESTYGDQIQIGWYSTRNISRCGIIGWTIDHPSSMWYIPEPSHFSIIAMPATMYRPSMHEAPM
ncbi:hypothetical protein J1N35_028115 [Gossypium stocksii]|uniref:Uncharacterized protein n=1 Tax=Gossypium stocksii TaxID=47602 RepID=A0A9D3ZRU1_9ROSI|nr:hypothetical protein J1N35_028115 [Gossypium stocksii]